MTPCPHCGTPNAAEARFCGACGLATSQTEQAAAPGAPTDMINREIAGRYRITAKLGEGGMGAVFKAEQISLKRQVAVKLLRPDMSGSAMLLRRFNAEAEAVAKLSHPNTVNIYDFGQDTDGTLFIAMELIDGRSLRQVIHAEAPLGLRRALAIAAQVAASLADAHARSLVHRDLKPDNVMLQERGRQRDVVRVLDFGIAKLRDERAPQAQMTQAGDMLGTPQYMAPEQIRAEPIDGRTDIYALGCMLYEMVTGRLPYEATTIMALLSKHLTEHAPPPSQRRPDLAIPPMIDELVMTAMAKDAGQRPPTMEAYGERIAAILQALPPDTGAPSAMHGAIATPPSWSAIGTAPPPPPTGPAPFAPSTPPPPSPTQPPGLASSPLTPMRGGSSRAIWLVLGLLVLGGTGLAIFFAMKDKQAPVAEAPPPRPDLQFDDEVGSGVAPTHVHDDDDDDDDDAFSNLQIPAPSSVASTADPWDSTTTTPTASAGIVEIASGVKVNVPPGFVVTRPDGRFVATGPGLVIVGAALPGTSTNEAELVRQIAQQQNLRVISVAPFTFAGAQRQIGVLAGQAPTGIDVIIVASVLIGPGYRVALAVAMPALFAQANPNAAEMAIAELGSRIILPSAGTR